MRDKATGCPKKQEERNHDREVSAASSSRGSERGWVKEDKLSAKVNESEWKLWSGDSSVQPFLRRSCMGAKRCRVPFFCPSAACPPSNLHPPRCSPRTRSDTNESCALDWGAYFELRPWPALWLAPSSIRCSCRGPHGRRARNISPFCSKPIISCMVVGGHSRSSSYESGLIGKIIGHSLTGTVLAASN